MLEQKRNKTDNHHHMRHLASAAFAVTLLAACSNYNNVNVLITNRGANDVANCEVRVPVYKLQNSLQIKRGDTLTVLNERNIPVDYAYSADSSELVFHVPLIRKHSQKTYSVNRSRSQLSDNLFRFRRENIIVNVE